jgi:Protein of unknown function (DUF3829)
MKKSVSLSFPFRLNPFGARIRLIGVTTIFVALTACGQRAVVNAVIQAMEKRKATASKTASPEATSASSAAASAAESAPDRRGSVVSMSGGRETSAEGADEKSQRQEAERLSAYVEAYNDLFETFGLYKTYERYVESDYTHAEVGESVTPFSKGWVYISVGKFEKADAMTPGVLPQVEKPAKELLQRLSKLSSQLDSLQAYFDTKEYLEDKLARIKKEDASVIENFESSVAAARKLKEVLDALHAQRRQVILGKMKAAGNMIGYTTELAMLQAKEIVDAFSGGKEISEDGIYKKCDPVCLELQQTLVEQQKHCEEMAKRDALSASSAFAYQITGDELRGFIGTYRTLKRSKEQDDFSKLVSDYNDAVEKSNDID